MGESRRQLYREPDWDTKYYALLDFTDLTADPDWEYVNPSVVIEYFRPAMEGELGELLSGSMFDPIDEFEKKFFKFRNDWRNKIVQRLNGLNGIEAAKQVEEPAMKLADVLTAVRAQAQIEASAQVGLKVLWMDLFNRVSYYNEIAGEILFHVLIGKLLSGCRVRKDIRTKIPLNESMFWIQDSRSGKDMALDFFMDVVKELEKRGKRFKTYNMNASDSPESFLDSYPKKMAPNGRELPQYDFSRTVPGLFSSHDFILSRECSFLFFEDRRSKLAKSELLLQALEGTELLQSLRSWQGHSTTTKPRFSFLGISRPVGAIKNQLLASGLFQRTLPFCRKITREERENMSKKVCENIANESFEYDKALRVLCDGLLQVAEMSRDKVIDYEDKSMFRGEVNSFTNLMFNEIAERLVRPELQETMNSFASQLNHHLLVLSAQNALVRGSDKISHSDLVEAEASIRKIYGKLSIWLENVMKPDKFELIENATRKRAMVEYLSAFPGYTQKMGAVCHFLAANYECSGQFAVRHLRELATSTKSWLKIEEKNKENYVTLIPSMLPPQLLRYVVEGKPPKSP